MTSNFPMLDRNGSEIHDGDRLEFAPPGRHDTIDRYSHVRGRIVTIKSIVTQPTRADHYYQGYATVTLKSRDAVMREWANETPGRVVPTTWLRVMD